MAETCVRLGGSVRERYESRCVLPLLRRRYPSVCVPTRDVERNWNWSQNGVFELPVLRPPIALVNSPTLRIGKTTTRLPGLSPTMRDVDRVLSTRCAVLRISGISGVLNLLSRLLCPRSVSAPKVMSSSLNCCSYQSSEHREELQCHVEEDTAERLVAKTVTNNIFTSLGRCDDRMTAGVVSVPRD